MEVNIGVVAFVLLGDHQSSSIGGIHNLTSGAERVPSIRMSMTFQRHDSIFEEGLTSGSVPLLDEQSGASFIGGASPPAAGLNEALKARFCPRILSGVPENDGFELLHGVLGTKPSGQYVGTIRFEVANTSYMNVDDNLISPTGQSAPIEGLLELEPHLQATANEGNRVPVLVPAIDANNGNRVGTIVLTLQVRAQMNGVPSSHPSGVLPPASSGLVSVVGSKWPFDERSMLASGGNDNKLLVWDIKKHTVHPSTRLGSIPPPSRLSLLGVLTNMDYLPVVVERNCRSMHSLLELRHWTLYQLHRSDH
jgi:hypothetical protein